jgi:hypothetical protein
MTTLNVVTGVVVGQYGIAITLQIVDDEGNVVDLSSFTSVTVKTRSPDARTTLSFTGTLVGGGTGGQFSFTPASGNTWDRDGLWEGQAQFTATSVLSLTVPFVLEVSKKI